MKRTRKTRKKDTSFATWKFEFENTVNADPRLGPACLCVVRTYLDWMGSPVATPFRSIGELIIATSLSRNTIIAARRDLEKEGYFVPQGHSSTGAMMYRLVNSGLNRVLDHVTIARETLREMEAEKKETYRKRRPDRPVGPSENERDMSSSKTEHQNPDVPFRNCSDSSSDSEPNYVYNTVDSIIREREAYLSTPLLDVQTSYSLAQSGDEANQPLPVPDSDAEASRMIAVICGGFEVSTIIRDRMTSMLMAGVLTPKMATGMLGIRKEEAA